MTAAGAPLAGAPRGPEQRPNNALRRRGRGGAASRRAAGPGAAHEARPPPLPSFPVYVVQYFAARDELSGFLWLKET